MSENDSSLSISKIMNLLGNEIRFNILKLIHSEPRSFSDLLTYLSMESSSKLSFHLTKLIPLIVKREDGFYEVSELGERAYLLITSFETEETLLDEFGKEFEKIHDAKLVSSSIKAYDAFLSCASQDKVAAENLCKVLEIEGIKCWLAPRNLDHSLPYLQSIKEAIITSKIIVVLFSTNANSSSKMKQELEYGIKLDLPIIPIRIEEVIPKKSLRDVLDHYGWVDAHSKPLEFYMDDLLDVIRIVLKAKKLYNLVDAHTVDYDTYDSKIPLGVRILEEFDGTKVEGLSKIIDQIGLPPPISAKDDTTNWIMNYNTLLKPLTSTNQLNEWLKEGYSKLVYGVRGLRDYCLTDAIIAVPPHEGFISPIQNCLLQRGKVGLFAPTGMGKSRNLLYLAYWWNRKFNSSVYYIEEPQLLQNDDWENLENFLRGNIKNSNHLNRTLLIIENFHLIAHDLIQDVKKIITGANRDTWSVIIAYTEKEMKKTISDPNHEDSSYFEIQSLKNDLLPLESREQLNLTSKWPFLSPFFYEWIQWVTINVFHKELPWKKWSIDKQRILRSYKSPWSFVIAIGYFDSALGVLKESSKEEIFPELLYNIVSHLFIITGENEIELSKLIALFEQSLREELQEIYHENWEDEIIKIIEYWTNTEIRLLPPITKKRVRGKLRHELVISPYHLEWANKVLDKVLFSKDSATIDLVQSFYESLIPEVFHFWQDLYSIKELDRDTAHSFLKWLKVNKRFSISSPGRLEIKELDLSCDNTIRSKTVPTIPESIGNLSTLEALDISTNKIEKIPDSINQLSKLKEFKSRFNKVSTLPKNLTNLSSLKILILNNCIFTILPRNISSLVNLEILDISNKTFSSEMEGEFDSRAFGGNYLSSLPNTIGDLTKLKILNVSVNKIKSLPQEIGKLAQLEELDLAVNSLKELPESIGNLANLKRLYLAQNNLRNLPKTIGGLKNLEKLQVSSPFQLASGVNPMFDMKNIGVKFLDSNKINELPDTIGHLTNLKELTIASSELESLPESFGLLQNLEILSLAMGKLKNLPESFKNLIKLRELSLGSNAELDNDVLETLSKLTKLEILDLQHSGITKIPSSFENLQSMKEMVLRGNKITNVNISTNAFQRLKSLHIDKTNLDEKSGLVVSKLEERGCEIVGTSMREELESVIKKRRES